MIGFGWNRGFVAVLIGAVLGLGGLAGQPPAQAAASSEVSSGGGYSERRPCGDCYDRERACDARRDAPPPCGECYDRQPRCGDCPRDDRPPCDRCEDKTSENRPDDRCADPGKSCEREGERRQGDDDDEDGYKREKKDEEKKDEREKKDEKEEKERSALHKILRGVFD